ncbi:MAG: response regulator [Dehalococcoidales bacterium]|nr:MAG: response regulator [Dehalococcoidales bacterium]
MAKILVVDDSALVRRKCSKVLSNNGYYVIEAENGVEAIEKYKEYKPDAVLMDIMMPLMHGISALHEIKKVDPVARVAMLTALGQKAMVTSALKEGAKDFVVKPFREGRVVDTVQRLLGNNSLDPY